MPVSPKEAVPIPVGWRMLQRVLEVVCLACVPLALLYAATLGQAVGSKPVGRHYAFDFYAIWLAGHHVLSGTSPYLTIDALRALPRDEIDAFVYPAPTAVAAAPLGAVRYPVAAATYTIVTVAALALGLRLLRVTDWRCYGAMVLCFPVFTAIRLGAVTPLLFLGTAVAWRYRDHLLASAMAVAAVVLLKVFLWPLIAWLAFTRRVTSAVLALLIAAAASAIGWAIIGFEGFRTYPSLLRSLSDIEFSASYSLAAMAHAAGTSRGWAYAAAAVCTFVALLVAARASRSDPDSSLALTAAIVTALVATPILWPHYLTLLFIPLAIARPRFDRWWLLPLALWLAPWYDSHSSLWKIALFLGLAAGAVAGFLRPANLGAPRTTRV